MYGIRKSSLSLSFSLSRYIYIYIYKMGLSYTWLNSCKVIHFLHYRFIRDLTAKKISLNAIGFHLIHN